MKNDQFNSHQKHQQSRTIKEPKIKNINVKFNGDKQGFDLFIKSLLSDYIHSGDVDKGQQVDYVDKVEISEDKEKVVDF